MKKTIKPRFNKKMPKNAASFFEAASDDAFKAEHPLGYKVLVACSFAALMLPMALYMGLILIYPAPNSGWIALGGIGAFIIGIGLFNIVAAWIGQYLGHLVTGLCIGVGSIMVAASVLLLYNKTLYNLIDQDVVSYYFVNMLFLCIPAIYYVLFRFGISCWLLGKRINVLAIRRSRKGRKNFWWYEDIHEQYNMGLPYTVNRLFTILYPAAIILHLLLGWIKMMSIPVSILLVLTCILAVPMSLFSSIQSNKAVHGQPFVLVARSENGGIDSFLFELVGALFPLGIAYAELALVAGLWDITWFS